MININPQPIILQVGPIRVFWYGLLIFFAFWLIFFTSLRRAKKYNFSKNDIYDFSFWLLIFGLIGARLYHVFSELPYYLKNPNEIVFFWHGGLGNYGAILAGIITLYFLAKIKKKPFLSLLDFYAPLIILGIAIGRWGNFFNQELYGQPSSLPWAIFIEPENRMAGYENFSFFHPTFFYESLFCFLLITFLFLRDRTKNFNGEIFFLIILLYPFFRFLLEFLRIDDQPIFLSLRLGQWMSLFFVLLSSILFLKIKKGNRKQIF